MIVAKFKKLILIFIGLICLSLGIVGYVIPGMPGTIFLIIAATLFVRSSDRLYKFVVENKLFGNQFDGKDSRRNTKSSVVIGQ